MKSFRQACALELVFIDLAFFIALEVPINSLSIFVGQVVLDISSSAAGKLGVTSQSDLDLIRFDLFIELLLVNHRVDFHECGRGLQLILRHNLHNFDLLL